MTADTQELIDTLDRLVVDQISRTAIERHSLMQQQREAREAIEQASTLLRHYGNAVRRSDLAEKEEMLLCINHIFSTAVSEQVNALADATRSVALASVAEHLFDDLHTIAEADLAKRKELRAERQGAK